MDPNAGQPQAGDGNAVMAAIASLKTDLEKSFNDRLAAVTADLDTRLQPVTEIQQTLEQARKNQLEVQQRQEAANRPGWKPTTWDDIPKLVDERAQEIAKKTLADRDQTALRQQQDREREEAELEAQLDRSLASLEQSGYLPKIGNPNDRNDPGVAARRELMSAAETMRTMELDRVADTLTQMHRNNMIFDSATKSYISAENSLAPLPGKYAPVGNSSVSSPNTSFATPSTRDIRNSSMDDLIALAERRGYGPVPTSVLDQPGGF